MQHWILSPHSIIISTIYLFFKTQFGLSHSGNPVMMPPISVPKPGQEPVVISTLPSSCACFIALTTRTGDLFMMRFFCHTRLFNVNIMSHSSLYPHYLSHFLAHSQSSINKVNRGMKTALWVPNCLHTYTTSHIKQVICQKTVVLNQGPFCSQETYYDIWDFGDRGNVTLVSRESIPGSYLAFYWA